MIFFSNPYLQYLERKKDIAKSLEIFFKKGNYILGSEVTNFEKSFANYCQTKYGVGVNSGTDAILLALKSLDIGIGDEVITTSHTAIATVAAIISSGAKPVLVDINPESYNMDKLSLVEAITNKTKAIVLVHIYGNPADIIEISNIGKQNNIPIIEDCAQATGAIFNNKRVGSFGLLSCFSFYPTKNLGALGDGGMVVTSNSRLAKKVERIRQYGWNKKRDIKYVGINSRLDEIHATILKTKLKYLDADNDKRISIANYYNKNLNFNRFKLPEKNILSKHVYHLYVIQVKNRKNIMNELLKKNIITEIHYKKAAHHEKKYAEKCKISKSRLKNTDKIVKKILSLPIYPQLKLKEVKYICDTINNIKN